MTVHPEPPPGLGASRLFIKRMAISWWRIHQTRYGALYFGRSGSNRFDAPASEFGALYVGKDPHCAFIETFGHSTGVRSVTERELRTRSLSRVTASRPLRLVDLCAEGLARMGADSALTSGTDYDLAHRWSLALHGHPRAPDGILYRARHDPRRVCAVLYDRVGPLLTAVDTGAMLDPVHHGLLGEILDTYDFGLISD